MVRPTGANDTWCSVRNGRKSPSDTQGTQTETDSHSRYIYTHRPQSSRRGRDIALSPRAIGRRTQHTHIHTAYSDDPRLCGQMRREEQRTGRLKRTQEHAHTATHSTNSTQVRHTIPCYTQRNPTKLNPTGSSAAMLQPIPYPTRRRPNQRLKRRQATAGPQPNSYPKQPNPTNPTKPNRPTQSNRSSPPVYNLTQPQILPLPNST